MATYIVLACDDITEIWRRFPKLDPETPVDRLPAGVPVLDGTRAAAISGECRSLAAPVAEALSPSIAALARAWDDAVSGAGAGPGAGIVRGATAGVRAGAASGTAAAPAAGPEWAEVADALVAGIGLGLAVPRQVGWHEPALFGVNLPGGRERAPFLRFAFLPAGRAGIGLLTSSSWPEADGLVDTARRREFAQTFQDYRERGEELVAYGVVGDHLRRTGILRRVSIGLHPAYALGIPAIGRNKLATVETPWRAFVTAAARAFTEVRGALAGAARAALGPELRPPGSEPAAPEADFLHAAYFVLADMVYGALRERDALRPVAREAAANGRGQGARAGGLLGRRDSGGRRLPVRALLIEEPAAVWQWLIGTG